MQLITLRLHVKFRPNDAHPVLSRAKLLVEFSNQVSNSNQTQVNYSYRRRPDSLKADLYILWRLVLASIDRISSCMLLLLLLLLLFLIIATMDARVQIHNSLF